MRPDETVSAASDPATRSWRRRVIRLTTGGVVLAAVLAASAFVLHLHQASYADRLATASIRTAGTVEQVEFGPRGNQILRVAYQLADQTPARTKVRVDSGRTYRPGDRVIVEYDPAAPSNTRTDLERNTPSGRGGPVVSLAVSAAALCISLGIVCWCYLPCLRDLRAGAVWAPANVQATRTPDGTRTGSTLDFLGNQTPSLQTSNTKIAAGTPVHCLARAAGASFRRTVLLRVPGRPGRPRPRFVLVARAR